MAKSGPVSHPIYVGAIYEARARQRDGVITWRRVGSFGRTCTSRSDKYVAEIRAVAPHHWIDGIRHGTVAR